MQANGSDLAGGANTGRAGSAESWAFHHQCWENAGFSNKGSFPKAQILGAIVLAKSKIRRLVKSDRNHDEAYAFASIDSFLEHLNPICVETGLVVLMNEVAVTDGLSGARQGQHSWLRITYDITLAHISGETLGPFRRHVDIPRTGPQAFGAAQSYVLKQFLRAQFQIATGEADDPDFGSKAGGGGPFANRAETGTAQSDGTGAEDHAMEIMALKTCAQRIAEAASGRELLRVLSGLADDLIAHPLLKAARLQALTRIVSTAPSVAALEKLEHHFAGDWAHVSNEAAHRRLRLDLLDSLAEEECAAKAAQAATMIDQAIPGAPKSHAPGDPASTVAAQAIPEAPDKDSQNALDFGDIPYQEAAA